MENERKYEELFGTLYDYSRELHNQNQHRIKIGLKCIYIIPITFFVMMLFTGSSKAVFLILYIISLFFIAIYLIAVEYSDFKLQEKLQEITDKEADFGALIQERPLAAAIKERGNKLKNKIQVLDIQDNFKGKEK